VVLGTINAGFPRKALLFSQGNRIRNHEIIKRRIIPETGHFQIFGSQNVKKTDADSIFCIEETVITVRNYRHRTTVPSKIFRFLDLRQGDSLRWIAMKDGTVFIKKMDTSNDIRVEK
jgi:hypothetical protein